MSNGFSSNLPTAKQTKSDAQSERWHTFSEILRRLHKERIYIHPHQLAEFMVRHGLPVDLRYVPEHLKQRAEVINANYQGDMVRVEAVEEEQDLFSFE